MLASLQICAIRSAVPKYKNETESSIMLMPGTHKGSSADTYILKHTYVHTVQIFGDQLDISTAWNSCFIIGKYSSTNHTNLNQFVKNKH